MVSTCLVFIPRQFFLSLNILLWLDFNPTYSNMPATDPGSIFAFANFIPPYDGSIPIQDFLQELEDTAPSGQIQEPVFAPTQAAPDHQ